MPTLEVEYGEWRGRCLRLDPSEIDRIGADVQRAKFSFAAAPSASVLVRPSLDGVASLPLTVYPVQDTSLRSREVIRLSAAITVIVPVFGDLPSLLACLDGLRAQSASNVAHVFIDDASPDPAIAAAAEGFACEMGGTYIRMPLNSGFAAAVNAGLALCAGGDVLILNSDVILPPNALRRLHSAASRSSDIGTISPLSNDTGCASFPIPLRGGPALPIAKAFEVDVIAAELNAGQVVDVPVPLGSCFYITRRCLDRLGRLSLSYGRGYYEDVDFHLRAGEAGLRRVVACDTYVTHLGGRSFGVDRQSLIERNHAILHRRFPDYAREDLLFDQADPLRQVRSTIEGRLAFSGEPATLIVARAQGSETLVRDRERLWREKGRWVLVLRWKFCDQTVAVECAVSTGSGPRSLSFTLDDSGRLSFLSYLERVGRGRVELLEPERMPACLVTQLNRTGRRIHLVIDSLASAVFAGGEVSKQGRSVSVVVRDRVAAAHLGVATTDFSIASAPSPEIGTRPLGARTLGVILPEVHPHAERFTLALARTLRCLHRTTRVVVLGQSSAPQRLMAPGNVWVTGPLGDDDPAEVVAHYAVDRIVSPYRTGFFWHVEDVARRSGRPKAYFDWSNGRLCSDPGDLALSYAADDDTAAKSLANWYVEEPRHRESESR